MREHPGITRKKQIEEQRSKMMASLENNPIAMIVRYAVDIIVMFLKTAFNFAFSMRRTGTNFVNQYIYGDGSKLIPSAEKYGAMVDLYPLRIVLTLMYPALGVFLSRGIYGLYHTLIAFGLTYLHILPGICYALVIINIPSYGDRFSEFDKYRLLAIRKLLGECDGVSFNNNKEFLPLTIFLISVSIFIASIYLLLKNL